KDLVSPIGEKIPDDLNYIVRRCLTKQRALRYASVSEALVALEYVLSTQLEKQRKAAAQAESQATDAVNDYPRSECAVVYDDKGWSFGVSEIVTWQTILLGAVTVLIGLAFFWSLFLSPFVAERWQPPSNADDGLNRDLISEQAQQYI